MRLAPRLNLVLLLPVALLAAAACDSDSDDDGADTGTGAADEHAEHGQEVTGGEGADPNAMVDWVTMPPATVAAGEAVTATFSVTTVGELHVAEMRACSGAGVADCGLGAMDSFESATGVDQGDGTYTASLTLDAGTWTVVAYSHIGPDPHVSDAVEVTVQ